MNRAFIGKSYRRKDCVEGKMEIIFYYLIHFDINQSWKGINSLWKFHSSLNYTFSFGLSTDFLRLCSRDFVILLFRCSNFPIARTTASQAHQLPTHYFFFLRSDPNSVEKLFAWKKWKLWLRFPMRSLFSERKIGSHQPSRWNDCD